MNEVRALFVDRIHVDRHALRSALWLSNSRSSAFALTLSRATTDHCFPSFTPRRSLRSSKPTR